MPNQRAGRLPVADQSVMTAGGVQWVGFRFICLRKVARKIGVGSGDRAERDVVVILALEGAAAADVQSVLIGEGCAALLVPLHRVRRLSVDRREAAGTPRSGRWCSQSRSSGCGWGWQRR